MQHTQGGCRGPPYHLQHQIGQPWPGPIPVMPSPTDSRSGGPPALKEVFIGRSTGLALSSPDLPFWCCGGCRSGPHRYQEPTGTTLVWSSCQCPTPAQASPSCDLSGQSVTTSSSPIWIYGCLAPRPDFPSQLDPPAPSVMALQPRLLVPVGPSPVLAVGEGTC